MSCEEQKLETRKIVIEIYEHESAGWFVAKSDDVPRFYAQGDSAAAIRRKVPHLLRKFYEAAGYCVDEIRTEFDKSAAEGLTPVKLLARARIDTHLPA